MPRASVPAVVATKATPLTLTDKCKEGYSFTSDRWEGEDAFSTAWYVVCWLRSQGWHSNVHEGSVDSWIKGKKTPTPYFKVWIGHPDHKELYAWWAPAAGEWNDPIKQDELTWFEFVQPDEKKK